MNHPSLHPNGKTDSRYPYEATPRNQILRFNESTRQRVNSNYE